MIEYSEPDQKERIIQKIISSGALKKKDGFAKHVINYIEKLGYNVTTGQQKGNTNPGNSPNLMTNSMNFVDNQNLGQDFNLFNGNNFQDQQFNAQLMTNNMNNNFEGMNSLNMNMNNFQDNDYQLGLNLNNNFHNSPNNQDF